MEANLNKVYFADEKHGLIVGDGGVILTTTNGGKKWEKQESDTENDLYGFALSPEGMVAVGKGGIAMRYSVDAEELPAELPPLAEREETTDVVEEQPTLEEVTYHWDIVRQATWQTDFTDTYFHRTTDEPATLRGWAVGSGGVIAHTTDGGKTWLPQHSGVKDDLRRITFIDEDHGWIAGRGILLRTENGGQTWQVIKKVVRNFRRISAMQFINTQEGWLGADQGQTLHTTDGGVTWKLQKTGTTNQPITALHFVNSTEGWAITPQRVEGGLVLHTINSGDYWEIQDKTHQPAAAVHFADTKSGWIVGRDGRSFTTQDGGVTWKQLLPEDMVEGLRRIKFHDHRRAWGIDRSGAILLTIDQGESWLPTYVGLETASELIAQSKQAEMETEADNAQEAQPAITNPLDDNFTDIFQRDMTEQRSRAGRFTPEGEVETDAEDTAVTQTNTETENRERPARRRRGLRQSGLPITNVHFVGDQHAWAVGDAGHIYHTENGGQTWERQLGEQLDDFRDILFIDNTHGWIVGDNGLLLETQNGGQTWTPVKSGTEQPLVGVHFANVSGLNAEDTTRWGWSMRRDGTVLYTTNGVKWSAGQTPTRPGLFEEDPPLPFEINDVAFGNFSEGWAVGRDGQIIHNQDGGPIWTPQRTSTGKDLERVEMKFAPLGWAVGHSGIIQRTINGGGYWKHHETDTGYNLYGVSFITKRKGWAAGDYGIILRTTGGGFKWEALSSGVTKTLYGILALSDQEIYTVGASGTILRSVDGGTTWEQEHTDISNNLYTIVSTPNDDTLWVVGQWGVVLRREISSKKMSMR